MSIYSNLAGYSDDWLNVLNHKDWKALQNLVLSK